MISASSNPHLPQAAIDSICIAIGDRDIKISQIGASESNDAVADFTHKYLVTSSPGTRYVLFVSNEKFPSMVNRAVSRIQDARSVLTGQPKDVAEMPIDHGSWEGVSYALWLYRFPLSTNRLIVFAQKHLLAPKVLAWLTLIAQQTQQNSLTSNDLRENFFEPLRVLSSRLELGTTLTRASKIAIDRITSGDFRPVHVLQHGDLWRGNVLIKGSLELLNPLENGFIVIDWGGARVSGYPFIDLLRFSMSCNMSPKTTASHIHSMREIVRCEPVDVVSYVLCALGKLYQELEQFPERSFIKLGESLINHLVAAGLYREGY
jgi:hypothetical protein